MLKKLTLILILISCFTSYGQNKTEVHAMSKEDDYVWPSDSQVLEKLEKWQDLKFGVLIHWGLYSVEGKTRVSWELCSEEFPRNKHNETRKPHDQFKKWYCDTLRNNFNPIFFNADEWAEIFDDAGMKYIIFTTKHHDGFCMYDSKVTDFSVRSTPFRNDPRMDITKEVFSSFRQKDFMIGAYFSKPDWHCEWFWSPYLAAATRYQNYKRELHPHWWKNFQDYTARQIDEITSNYGNIDILWLDGGWITGDEIKLDDILIKARQKNPGMLSVDRTIKGKNENYQTPERTIPKVQKKIPWESCIPLSDHWGWRTDSELKFKSARTIVNMLIEICAKGGALALGVGPTGQGQIQPEVVKILSEIGDWLEIYGKAIYSTRITENYHQGNIWFTADKNENTLYALYALPEGENLPQTITWEGNIPNGKVTLLHNNKKLRYKTIDNKTTVYLPKSLENNSFALEFELDK